MARNPRENFMPSVLPPMKCLALCSGPFNIKVEEIEATPTAVVGL